MRVVRADPDGIELWGFGDRPIDVLFDGRRVWSFWLERDTVVRRLPGRRTVRWPVPLRRYLDGRAVVTIREHVADRTLFEGELHFGTGTGRVAVVGKNGAPLGIDKSGKMAPTFESRTEREMTPLLDAIEAVVAALERAGVEPFLAYGTLLGAIREQDFLGHDSDADLGYVSHCEHPADVARESFEIERALRADGFHTYRYSGAAIRVDVAEDDGVIRGLDVFGGFLDEGRLYLMGEVGVDYDPAWIRPRTTATLAGRSFPVPAVPERLLEAMYGASWAVPDPAFHFETPARTIAQLSGWFRGNTHNRRLWERFYGRTRNRPPRGKPSSLARRIRRQLPAGTRVLDVGAGRGVDALWLARRGLRVSAYDYVPSALRLATEQARSAGVELEARSLNLGELRSVLGEAAWVARQSGPRVVLARHVADATNDRGRELLALFASMTLRGGGRLYAEVWTGDGERPDRLEPVALDGLAELLVRSGAKIIRKVELPVKPGRKGRSHSIGRLVAQWD
ncbi:MAG: methyltransferase domain-containing protein [Nocardioides sp.]